MKQNFTARILKTKVKMALVTGLLVFIFGLSAHAQLGVYSFTGFGACPNQNPAVNSQPANASFSNFTSVGTTCWAQSNTFNNYAWNTGSTISLTEYNQFTITPNPGFGLTLSSITFTHATDQFISGGSTWILRSSLDNFTTNIATGNTNTSPQTSTVNLPAATFTNIGTVSFRFYINNAASSTMSWIMDEVTVNGNVIAIPANPANPTSNSPQCVATGVTMNFSGTPPAGETWYWQTSATGTSTANSSSGYTVTTSGNYYLRSRNNSTLNWSSGAGYTNVIVVTMVGTPVFVAGPVSTRCQGAGTVNYSAGASNNTGLTYSLDAVSIAAGNTINALTGDVTYGAGWSGVSTITVTATGCGGPTSSTHTATTLSISDQAITANPLTICSNNSSVVTVASTQSGINYTLRDNANNNIIAGPTAGTGSPLTFNTGNLTSTKTYNVLAELPGSSGALAFDGVNDYVLVPDAPNLDPANITLECWVKISAYQAWSVLILKADPQTWYNGYGLTMNNVGNKFAFFVNNYPNGFVVSNTTPALNTWYHVAATYDGNTTKIYVNGVLEASAPYIGANYNTVNPLLLGGSISGTAWQLNGALDEVRIWNTARSAAQILNNMNNTLTGSETNLVAYYPFEAGSGSSTLTDIAGGDNNGSLTNMNVSTAWVSRSFTQCSSQMATTPTVTVLANVANPAFALGNSSSRCFGAGVVNYSATAANNTGMTYTLDAASLAGNNTINSTTGDVTYDPAWVGTTIITATASGCPNPRSANHTVTVKGAVATPVFTLGATSTRCQGNQGVTYTATAANNSGITYSLDPASIAGGNNINAGNGQVSYQNTWSGTSVITATATGCNGPTTSIHTVTITPTVSAPVFPMGATSTRCQGAGVVNYGASAANSTSITYSLNAAALSAGNTINATTGDVTYVAGWTGSTIITAIAAGCNGPSAGTTHTVTITPSVGTPAFSQGAISVRCQGAGIQTFTATATNSNTITYSLDAASLAAGNTIDPSTGAVTFVPSWFGPTTITATATGCNSTSTGTTISDTRDPVLTPVFAIGSSTIRCKGSGTVNYSATATNALAVTYSLDAASILGGVTINQNTGDVTYPNSWIGTTIITASASGCSGPTTSTHSALTNGSVTNLAFNLGNSSTVCQASGTVNYTATALYATSITYSLDASSLAGGNTINPATGAVTYAPGWSGSTTVTATAAGCNGPITKNHSVTITPTVVAPVFNLGSTSTRCQGNNSITYQSSASYSTSIVYTLDAASLAAGNTITTDGSGGKVTYTAGWTGTSVITATALGCNGPASSIHTVTITPTVGTPAFIFGATSTRCQGANTVNYGANATNNTGITYTLDNASRSAGNTINAATGDVTYVANWLGTSFITASAAGCNGPVTSTHSATSTPSVVTPAFALGALSVRCQGAGTSTFTATASNSTGMTYSLDAASLAAGNTINSATGAVTFVPGWFGPVTITATATGCNGPTSSTHISDTRNPVLTPVFTLGASSIRCKAGGVVNYSATATNALAVTYSIDAASIAGGVTINANTGDVSYPNGWIGTTIITASASGCNGPTIATHSALTNGTVTNLAFNLGNSSSICQASGTVNYTATALYATSITYSLDAASLAGGNSINPTTGDVTYAPGWSGSTTVTASATGCNGPITKSHSVSITSSVGTPVFALGATSIRCQGNNSVTYTATAASNTSMVYSLDAASLAAGNTIIASGGGSAGKVTYTAGWTGTSIITVTASGCNSTATSTHTVTITPSVGNPVFTLGATSTRCQGAGVVNYGAAATTTTGITYTLDNSSLSAGNTINVATGDVTYVSNWSGTSIITASAAGCNGPLTATHTVTITPTVGTPVFSLGATSTRCIGAGTVTYTAAATNNTGITYSLDATTQSLGCTIDPATGMVTWSSGWAGTSTITATANGCNGPSSSNHTVTTNINVTTPVFNLGSSSMRCQGATTVTYTANANNATGITYSLDAASLAALNTINSSTGAVTFKSGWTGTSVITATAAGCGGPLVATHTVTITPSVGIPVFALGASSVRCQGAATVSYTATAVSNTGITYSLDVPSTVGGNTINASTGAVTYTAGWTGTTTITATATGCSGPATATHTVTITGSVATPGFSLGSSSTRCQGANSVTYTATAANSTAISYSLDAASITGGNTINATTGLVSYAGGWSGTSVITVTATGCNGPATATHTITTTPTVGTPSFTLSAASTRCQGANTVNYGASATNSTGITYTLNAAAITGGNTINATTGDVTYAAGWTGSTIITASAAGCNGPKTATHTVTITPTVGTPVFTLGASSTRCQGAATITYTATATNSTGITFSLDAISQGAGNSIIAATGAVTYVSGWTGTSVITATATGCNGPTSSTHTVTVSPTIGTPNFTLGATSIRCQGLNSVSYVATASNSTGMSYALDAASIAGGNVINAVTGLVSYASNWTGTSVITATATGCNGPKTSTHTVTITPTVSTPVFVLGASSVRCQGANTVNYSASATNSTGITYSLDATSIAAGIGINGATGDVTYPAAWTGTTLITASASGCNGPATSTHTVTTNITVGATSFTLGATSSRCQGAGTVTYTATATNNTGITYSLDAASIAAGNTINAATGAVTYTAGWSGTSLITANAAGCNGPTTAVHTVTTTPTVGTPVFALGNTSTRCQGAATITYTATSANNAGLSYSLDAASIAAGNTIDAATGTVTFVAGWAGSTTIIAIASGCNGPTAATHVVTVTPSIGIPVFTLGLQSVRTQGAGTVTYTATSSNSTGITYTLDPGSLSGGNTINAATGAVTYTAGWNGTSMITATAIGCNGPTSSNHIVTINATVAQTPLYLSDPGQTLDRNDPVTLGYTNTIVSPELDNGGNNTITFTQIPALCNDLVIKAQTVSVLLYINITGGNMTASPNVTALLNYGGTNIITLTNPIYNSATGIITWSGLLGADVTVPAGQAISLQIINNQGGVKFKINYHSNTKPSRISLLPVSTFIDITTFDIYNAPYPNGSIRTNGSNNITYYARATATTPFGYKDITGMTINITPPAPGTTVTMTCVDSSSCTRTYEYAWTTPATGVATYYLMATAKEGYENNIKNSELLPFGLCTFCPPVARNDSAQGDGGAPLIVDVLANDYDPNNNIKPSTLAIATQPNNGTAYISNGLLVYLPNGTYAGKDTIIYRICDSTALCSIAQVFITINPLLFNACSEATNSHVYYLPFSENEARIALDSSSSVGLPSTNIRTITSLKMPYPGMIIVWDHWEDGYEANPLSPTQSTTQVWGDGNPYNGIAPGYANDIIPAGGSIVLNDTIATNPRVATIFKYDGRDKIYSSGQITVTQVCGEPSIMQVQCMKTNVSAVADYGTSFTIPVGQNFPSQDFRYTSLFIRAAYNNTQVSIDKKNSGIFDTTLTLNEGQVYFVNSGVMNGAVVTATKPIGVDLHFGGHDGYSSRDVPIFPASWYGNAYYSPVPTTGRAANPADTNAVMFYNSLNRPININYTSGMPSSGTINLPPKTVVRFPLPMSQTAAYKFVNPTGESFTAIEICDSYTPGGGGNSGADFDWSFNLISEQRLTDMATVAWAPGSIDGSRDDNPIWVTPASNTTIYVKYNGNIGGTTGKVSLCGFRYDTSFVVNALNHKRLFDLTDKDQSGLAVYTCDGTKIAAVYGEDASTAQVGNPSWDVGSTLQPFCKAKLIFANDDYARTMVNAPVTIPILVNDFGFLAVVDASTVSTSGLLQPKHGIVTINANGTVIYTPNIGYVGKDTFEYNVCSTPSPVVCDHATVYVDISACPAPYNENVIAGQVFFDKNKDGLNNDGSNTGVPNAKVYLYADANCNGSINAMELKDSVITDASGTYQFVTYPERFVADDFDGPGGTQTCANGSDGNASWLSDWVDAGDQAPGICNYTQQANKTHADIFKDGAFSYAMRLKNKNVSVTRTVNLTGASYAFLSFSYRRKSATFVAGDNVTVQASSNGTTFGTIFTIAGDGTTDANYVNIYNQDITAYAGPVTYIRFLTNNNMQDADTVYIDNVKVQFLKYPMCYITKYDSTGIPAYYHTTTNLTHNMTATSSTTCLAPYDFGITKNTMSISGTLFNDANGLTDLMVNGTGTGIVNGTTVYAYLIDTSGIVAYKATLAANGSYNFPTVDVYSSLTMRLSTQNLTVGNYGPPDAYLPTLWMATGDTYGANNLAGTGIESGVPTCSVPINTGILNITGVNFGVEKQPDSDDKTLSYPLNTPGLKYAVSALSGSDYEDGVLGSGKTYKVTSLPGNAVLYYNSIAVTLNQVISAFNPLLLKIDPDDTTTVSLFTYAAIDAAGVADPSPATVTVTWGALLPISLLDFNGKMNGTKVDLFWKTSTESNSDHFDVERSTSGMDFKPIAKVSAKGFSSIESNYASVDPLPEKGVNYYRLKMVDKDAAFVYSKIIAIQVNTSSTLNTKVMPNPFTGKLDIYLTLPRNGNVVFNFVDINGKVVYTKSVKGYKGFNWFVVNDLDRLPAAPYILDINTDEGKITQKLMKQ